MTTNEVQGQKVALTKNLAKKLAVVLLDFRQWTGASVLREEDFQKHIFDEHHLLFCQYIGLISDKISFEEYVIRPVKRIPKTKKRK